MLNNNLQALRKANQQGVALVLCLVLASVFAAISIYTSEKEKQQLKIFMGLQEKVEQHFLAHTITQKIHYSTLTSQPFMWLDKEVELNGYGDEITLANPMVEDGVIEITIQDVLGLLSISSPNARDFVNVINNLSDDSRRGEQVMDAWFDWEDTDDLARINGKEKDEFGVAPYLPRNDKFQLLSEVSLVEGMDKELFDKLEPHLVYVTAFDFSDKLASDELRQLLNLSELNQAARTNVPTRLPNGLAVEQSQGFKIGLNIQGQFSRFQRKYVINYRPDEVRLVSISEFGD